MKREKQVNSMRFFKYTLLLIGLLGLIASIYNMNHTQSFDHHSKGLVSALSLIVVSVYLKTILISFKKILNSGE